MKQCPSCQSRQITLYMGFQFGNYLCKKCGYIGPLIVETGKKKKSKQPSSSLVSFLTLLFVLNLAFLLFAYAFFDTVFYSAFYNGPLQAEHEQVLAYLQGDTTILLFLNEREQQHMVDVKGAIQRTKQRFVMSLIALPILLVLLYCKTKKYFLPALRTGLKRTGILLIVFTLFLALAAQSFPTFFTAFHSLFFEPGTWVFPADSFLLQIYPLYYFVAIVTLVLQKVLVFGIVLLLLGKALPKP